jgi:hypothetical protein
VLADLADTGSTMKQEMLINVSQPRNAIAIVEDGTLKNLHRASRSRQHRRHTYKGV